MAYDWTEEETEYLFYKQSKIKKIKQSSLTTHTIKMQMYGKTFRTFILSVESHWARPDEWMDFTPFSVKHPQIAIAPCQNVTNMAFILKNTATETPLVTGLSVLVFKVTVPSSFLFARLY